MDKLCPWHIGRTDVPSPSRYWEVNYIDVYDAVVVPTPPTQTPPDEPQVTALDLPSVVPVSSNVTFSPASSIPAKSSSITGRASSTGTITSTATSSTPSPVDTISPAHNPETYNGWAYLGCFASTMGFSTFDLGGQDPALTLEKCIDLCGAEKYAGAVDS